MSGANPTHSSIRPTVFIQGGTAPTRAEVEADLFGFTPASGARDATLVILIECLVESIDACVRRIASCREENPGGTIVFLACSARSDGSAVAAFRARVTDYLQWPAERTRLVDWCERLSRASRTGVALLGSSRAMDDVRATLRQFAAVNCRVLISGETGTGKEVAARTLHNWSRRAHRPFVTVNCPAIPDTLFESELFGFERGAFSGAVHAYAGRLMEADQGSVFLDEVGELPLSVQAKLLRAMEHSEVQRLGGRGSHRIDVRWIAATNRDLRGMVSAGTFRADLYYRLCVAETVLPPLREHKEDVAELSAHFAGTITAELGLAFSGFLPEAMAALEAHDWPGNLRELRNAVETALIRAAGTAVRPAHLPATVTAPSRVSPGDEAERIRILDTLEQVHWNKSEAAKKLHWSRMTLYRKLAYHRLEGKPSEERKIAV